MPSLAMGNEYRLQAAQHTIKALRERLQHRAPPTNCGKVEDKKVRCNCGKTIPWLACKSQATTWRERRK